MHWSNMTSNKISAQNDGGRWGKAIFGEWLHFTALIMQPSQCQTKCGSPQEAQAQICIQFFDNNMKKKEM